jgi:hypothetical protein
MFRFWKAPLIAVLALGSFFVSAPTASAAFRGGFRGGAGFYGGGFYGGGWGWGPGYYGWYGPGYYYGYGPDAGKVKIVTPDKSASVFVDGGYVGPVAKAKKFQLQPGAHDLELRDPNGRTLFDERVQVIRGRTTEVHTNPAG